MPVLFELLVGLLTVLAIGSVIWFAGAYIIVAAVLFVVLFVVWIIGQALIKTIKGVA